MERRPVLFISYSHRDEEWKDHILRHLRVFQRHGALEIFDTSDIEAGSEWATSILNALRRADLALILISPDALASDFIAERELPALINRSREGGIVVLPVHIRSSLWTQVPGLAELQSANAPSEPLAELSPEQRDRVLTSIAERVGTLVRALGQRQAGSGGLGGVGETPGAAPYGLTADLSRFFISHTREDGDFAELLALRMERNGLRGWIDMDRLGPGVDWQEEIDTALRTTPAVIAVMSPEARASEYVTYEWSFAWGCGTTIIPVMLRETSLHPRLARLQYLDFTKRIARPWQKLYDALNESSP